MLAKFTLSGRRIILRQCVLTAFAGKHFKRKIGLVQPISRYGANLHLETYHLLLATH